jgi:DnaJ-class molecular chaperone
MARDEEHSDGGDSTEASHGPQECMPCRGSGRVVSSLGGETNKITCPWCQGEGTRQYGIDAQASWLEGAGGEEGETQAVEAQAG